MEDILVVDDCKINIKILKRILMNDYEVHFALDGETALEFINSKAPDLVLLDVMMPGMNGYEVCEKLKACKQTRDIPVIFVTSTCDYETEARCFDVGAVDYIAKPVEPLVIRARVKSQLIMRKQRDALKRALMLHEEVTKIIAHDIRTPLNTIAGYSELSLYQYDSAKLFEYLQKIRHQANQLTGFIDDILLLARQEKTGLQLELSLANVGEIAIAAASTHRGIADVLGVSLKLELPERKLQMPLDVKLFKRVLENLIANAIKFSPPDTGVTLRLVHIEQSDCKYRARIQIIDQGIDFPEEHSDDIFDKVAIVELKQKGLSRAGFELAFCKMAVEAHGGNISVIGNHPAGTIFTIEI